MTLKDIITFFTKNWLGKLGFAMLLLSPFSMAFSLVFRDYVLLGVSFIMLVMGGANLVYLTNRRTRK